MEHPPVASRHITPIHCTHLRHKGMYVFSDGAADAEYADDIQATAFWCSCTQKPFGPDGHPVNARDCAAGRGCCEH